MQHDLHGPGRRGRGSRGPPGGCPRFRPVDRAAAAGPCGTWSSSSMSRERCLSSSPTSPALPCPTGSSIPAWRGVVPGRGRGAAIRALITAAAVAGSTRPRCGPRRERSTCTARSPRLLRLLLTRSLTPCRRRIRRLRRDCGLRPVPELFPPPVGAHRREPGVSLSPAQGL